MSMDVKKTGKCTLTVKRDDEVCFQRMIPEKCELAQEVEIPDVEPGKGEAFVFDLEQLRREASCRKD